MVVRDATIIAESEPEDEGFASCPQFANVQGFEVKHLASLLEAVQEMGSPMETKGAEGMCY